MNIVFDTDIEELIISFDMEKMERIILNLISNAVKFRKENKGKIIISITHNDEFVNIRVKDNGIGIPKESLNRIFERFYRVDKARSRDIGGTGLGLAITKHMVKSLGGNIEVNSILGVGSDFIVTIPQNTE